MKNIAITGFMASGKTETSKELAKISGFKFVDTDDMIVRREGRSINEIFERDGEEYFRQKEYETVLEAGKMRNTIISTGGGVVLSEDNMKALRENSVVFNLSPSFDVIKTRIEEAAKTRPLMKNSSIEEIHNRFMARIPYYSNCDYKIEIDFSHTPIMIAKKIWEIYRRI